jgi:hypothetical protein
MPTQDLAERAPARLESGLNMQPVHYEIVNETGRQMRVAKGLPSEIDGFQGEPDRQRFHILGFLWNRMFLLECEEKIAGPFSRVGNDENRYTIIL